VMHIFRLASLRRHRTHCDGMATVDASYGSVYRKTEHTARYFDIPIPLRNLLYREYHFRKKTADQEEIISIFRCIEYLLLIITLIYEAAELLPQNCSAVSVRPSVCAVRR